MTHEDLAALKHLHERCQRKAMHWRVEYSDAVGAFEVGAWVPGGAEYFFVAKARYLREGIAYLISQMNDWDARRGEL